MKFNELSLVKTVLYQGTDTADKNGKMPIMLLPISGKFPSLKQVNSGSLCERKGVEVGKVYLVRTIFKGTSLVHGADFDWEPLQEITSGLEMIKLTQELGEGEVVFFDKPEISEKYNRSGTAIESERTRQIKSGTYIPANTSQSVRDHSNAKEVIKGSSQEGDVVRETRKLEKEVKKDGGQEGQSGKAA